MSTVLLPQGGHSGEQVCLEDRHPQNKTKEEKERRESHPESELEAFAPNLQHTQKGHHLRSALGPVSQTSPIWLSGMESCHMCLVGTARAPQVFHVACLKYAARPSLLPPDSEAGGQSLHLISFQREGLRCNQPKQDLPNAHMPTAPD